jgi:glycerate kinase
MKVAILGGPYKENLSAEKVCYCIKRGLRNKKSIKISTFWMADGGIGTAKRLKSIYNAKEVKVKVTGPNNKKTLANIYINRKKRIALFDVAEACGIHLLKENEKDPSKTTTIGVGEIVKWLLLKNFKEIFIGLGDTGTNDGGIGMLQGLNWKFFDKNGNLLSKRFDFKKVVTFLPGINKKIKVTCLSDGLTTLCGKNSISLKGAVNKGATRNMAAVLEKEMTKVNRFFKEISKKDFRNIPGSGSAGGLGATFQALFGAKIIDGADFIFKKFNLLNKFKNTDIVITSEGEINYQTIEGKTPYKVAKKFSNLNIPTVIFVGSKGRGFSKIFDYNVLEVIKTDIGNKPFKEIRKNKLAINYIYQAAKKFGRRMLC